jgi:uncharacterized repeat protein (TIGR04138 family)
MARSPEKTLQQVVETVGTYPIEAYVFVREGLSYTADQIHGQAAEEGDAARHITGRDLCLGLREFALQRWGLLARTVLGKWNITTTMDFGRIVFALVEHSHMQKTDEDDINDFRQVFDFRKAFDADYRISAAVEIKPAARVESKK